MQKSMRMRGFMKKAAISGGLFITALLAACGGSEMNGGIKSQIENQAQVASAGPQPWLIDWNAADRQDMSIRLSRGVVLVSYDEEKGVLAQLPAFCRVDGGYIKGEAATRPRQTEEMSSSADVHAKLGIYIANAQAGFQQGNTWKLDYVAADVRAADRAVNAAEVPKGCKGATHYVNQAFFGAYTLDTGKAVDAGVSVGAEAGPVEGEVSGSGNKSRTFTLKDGDVEKCLDLSTPATDPACLGILKIELAKIE